MRVLDEHPQWLEALRERLLTRELMEMPRNLAEFVAATERRFEEIDRRFEAIDRRFEAIDRRFEEIDRRFEEIDRRFEEIDRRFEEIDRRFEAIDRRFEAIDRRFDLLERQFEQLRTDIAPLKAAHARTAAVREADLMAEEQGLSFVGILGQEEIRALVRSSDTGGISKHDLRSFRLADIVLRATDRAGEECYVAVEVSYTANGRDTSRAQRNAGFLTRFTGRRAYAVVAGLRFDERIRVSVESDEVSWFQLDPEVLDVE